jgi:hypothetical protein
MNSIDQGPAARAKPAGRFVKMKSLLSPEFASAAADAFEKGISVLREDRAELAREITRTEDTLAAACGIRERFRLRRRLYELKRTLRDVERGIESAEHDAKTYRALAAKI